MEYLPTASITVLLFWLSLFYQENTLHKRCKDRPSAKIWSNDIQNLYNICSSEYVQTSTITFFSVIDNIVLASTNIAFSLAFITVNFGTLFIFTPNLSIEI